METNETSTVSFYRRPWVVSLAGIFVVLAAVSSLLIYKWLSSEVSTDMAVIEAPMINIGPETPGTLDAVYVRAGDSVTNGQALAHIGGETLYAKTNGTILMVNNVPGQVFAPGQAVLTMIDPQELRVVATIDENKGLSLLRVGEPVSFTVDAFGGQTFTGLIDEISPTAKDTGVVFSISDKREVRQFTIKVKYDVSAHPEFRNGMSAKISAFVK